MMSTFATKAIYRIDPVPLRYVNEVYYPGVFGHFSNTVQQRITEFREKPTELNREKIRFYEFLLSRVDVKAFERLQDEYLDPPVDRGCLKYLDPVSWFEHKFEFAHMLELDRKPPMRILDLGTGPAHFMLIAEFYGHEVIGTDLPDDAVLDHPSHFYRGLSEIFHTRRMAHRIEPFQELTDLPKNIDLVTAFSVAFNLSRGKLWDIEHWTFFLRSLSANVLNENGTLFMTLMKKKLDDEIWSFLKARASYVLDAEKYILINKFD